MKLRGEVLHFPIVTSLCFMTSSSLKVKAGTSMVRGALIWIIETVWVRCLE